DARAGTSQRVIEGVVAIVILAHAVALLWLSRGSLIFRWPLALGVALLCGSVLSGALLQYSVLASPVVYPASIVVGAVILSRFTKFDWMSLYVGALMGSAIAWYGTAPAPDTFAGLFVVGPCVVYALVGAVFGRLIKRA
ncbi:MAG: hypothetical protein OES09_11395, partial [Gammaproteobacteria bacterium]|nr:hypothetical protein [Gammaproteobacteria bacterium]